MTYNTLPSQEIIEKTKAALEANGIQVIIAENGAEAKQKVLGLLPQNAEVMDMTSTTLDTIGLSKEIQESEKYNSVKKKLMTMDKNTQGLEMKKLGSAPEYAIGSVHAVTTDGHILIASNTGSQLAGYVYGSAHVIFVVGAQKIVGNTDDGITRIYDYVLPLESERAKKAYGVPGSFVSKLLIFNREVTKNRVTVILVKEVLGF